MNILNNRFQYLNKSASVMSDNKVLGPVIAILLILFAVFMAPKLSKNTTNFIDNSYFKIIFLLVIILLAKKNIVISLICLIIFFILLNSSQVNNSEEQEDTLEQQPVNTLEQQHVNTLEQQPVNNTEQLVNIIEQPVDLTIQQVNPLEPQVKHFIPSVNITDQPVNITYPPVIITNPPINITDPPVNITDPPVKTVRFSEDNTPFATLHPSVDGIIIPNIPISIASSNVLSDDVRSITIAASTIPITPDITESASKTIVDVSKMSDKIIDNIKDNKDEYIDVITQNEKTIRENANNLNNPEESQQLFDTADKLATVRNAVTDIINNNNPDINHVILKSLVKSDLLKEAAANASNSGDHLTSKQLDQVSLSNANVANSLIQSNILKSSPNSETLWDAHIKSSLNMINYNHNMEMSLDAFNKGNYVLSKKYHDLANTYLDNNITLNGNIKGIAAEKSDKLYEQVNYNNTYAETRCDSIPAVNISGVEDYAYANF